MVRANSARSLMPICRSFSRPISGTAFRRRGRNAGARTERAHGDGIEVDFHSPEALDEVYWRIFAGDDYIRADRLVPHVPGDEQMAGYRDFIRLVLRRTGRSRYLSKNNNNLLRLDSLAKAFPDSSFSFPIRDPLDHARSLLNQHRRFLGSDGFTRAYMGWLGHHEFGATHRPFVWDGAPPGRSAGARLLAGMLDRRAPAGSSAWNASMEISSSSPYHALMSDAAILGLRSRAGLDRASPLKEIRFRPDRYSGRRNRIWRWSPTMRPPALSDTRRARAPFLGRGLNWRAPRLPKRSSEVRDRSARLDDHDGGLADRHPQVPVGRAYRRDAIGFAGFRHRARDIVARRKAANHHVRRGGRPQCRDDPALGTLERQGLECVEARRRADADCPGADRTEHRTIIPHILVQGQVALPGVDDQPTDDAVLERNRARFEVLEQHVGTRAPEPEFQSSRLGHDICRTVR